MLEVGWYWVLALRAAQNSTIIPILVDLRLLGLVLNPLLASGAPCGDDVQPGEVRVRRGHLLEAVGAMNDPRRRDLAPVRSLVGF